MAFDFGAGTSGALSGAGTGAALGSFGGPIGTGVGTGIGALLGLLSGIRSGQPQRNQLQQSGESNLEGIEQLQRFNPEQQQAFAQILQQALGQLQNPQQGFQPQADLAREQFQQNTVPSLAERFTSMGSGGAQRSSAFAGELGQAGAGLESQLAALGSQFGQRQQGLSQQLLGMGLTPQFEHFYRPQQESMLSRLGGLGSQFGGQALGSYLGSGGSFGRKVGQA